MTYNRYRGFPKSSVNFGNRQLNFLTKLLFSSVKTIVKGSSSNSKSVGSKSKRTNIPTYSKLNVKLVPVQIVENIMQKYNLLIDKSLAQLDKNHKLYNSYKNSKGLQIKEFKHPKIVSREYKPITKFDLQIKISNSVVLIYTNLGKIYSSSTRIPNKEHYENDMSFWNIENINDIIESFKVIDTKILKKY
ncbi:MAG: hypothetical protein H6Q15_2336 [Bacteroidetes bacterium]|nr:hypothetical protein [Bacteroidota bacterium]